MREITQEQFRTAITPYVSGSAKTCSYCDLIEELVLLMGPRTYVTIAIGQFMEGYLQICTRKHRISLSGLRPDEIQEFWFIKGIVRDTLESAYATGVVGFEHGRAGSCMSPLERASVVTDLCHHTHFHLVPQVIDIRSEIRAMAEREYVVSNEREFQQLKDRELGAKPYLYYEDTDARGYVFVVEESRVPRQFLRSTVARRIGLAGKGDWMSYPGVEFFGPTRRRLMPLLIEKARAAGLAVGVSERGFGEWFENL